MNSPSIPATNALDILSKSFLTAVMVLICVTTIAAALSYGNPDKTIHDLGGFPILTAWAFFTRRYDFIQGHFKTAGRKLFRFRVLQHRVVVISGKDFRKTFFTEAGLNLGEGHRILVGDFPSLEKMRKKEEFDVVSSGFVKRVLRLLRKDRVTEILPTLLGDVSRKMKDWGTEGTINPFNEVYDLVLQITVRVATCRELSEDPQSIQKLKRLYRDVEKSSTPVAVLLPWFPGLGKRKGKQATIDLYNHLKPYLDVRRKAETPSLDAFDILIAEGASDDVIIGTVMGIILAGVANTGVNSCWAVLYLGANPLWKQKATDELMALVANYTDLHSSDSLHKQLSAIPPDAWEDELPSLDLIIRETLRLTSTGTLLRRNMDKTLNFDETVVEYGDFVAYSLADVHLNPELYSDPLKFEPERYLEGNEEDKKETFGYLAWGAGRHPCAGMKIAKLEIKLILAMFLLGYEYKLVDGTGKFPKNLPQHDRNDIHQARPLGDPCYLKFKQVK